MWRLQPSLGRFDENKSSRRSETSSGSKPRPHKSLSNPALESLDLGSAADRPSFPPTRSTSGVKHAPPRCGESAGDRIDGHKPHWGRGAFFGAVKPATNGPISDISL